MAGALALQAMKSGGGPRKNGVFFSQSDTHMTKRITNIHPPQKKVRTHFGNIGMMCVCQSFFISQFGASVLFRGMIGLFLGVLEKIHLE